MSFDFLGKHVDNSVSVCRSGAGSLLLDVAVPALANFGSACTGMNGAGGFNISLSLGLIPVRAGSFR